MAVSARDGIADGSGHRQLRLFHLQPRPVLGRAGRRRRGAAQRPDVHRGDRSPGARAHRHLTRPQDSQRSRDLSRADSADGGAPAHPGRLPRTPSHWTSLRRQSGPRAGDHARQDQRHSVNIITGTIKANFPARIGFKVSSKIDSRTILDAGGADQLIGKGDMLISYNGEITRLQCAFVDTPEVEEITNFIGKQQGYPEDYKLPEYVDEKELEARGFDLEDRDPLFEDAARLIVA